MRPRSASGRRLILFAGSVPDVHEASEPAGWIFDTRQCPNACSGGIGGVCEWGACMCRAANPNAVEPLLNGTLQSVSNTDEQVGLLEQLDAVNSGFALAPDCSPLAVNSPSPTPRGVDSAFIALLAAVVVLFCALFGGVLLWWRRDARPGGKGRLAQPDEELADTPGSVGRIGELDAQHRQHSARYERSDSDRDVLSGLERLVQRKYLIDQSDLTRSRQIGEGVCRTQRSSVRLTPQTMPQARLALCGRASFA